jgi:hypothetical protein
MMLGDLGQLLGRAALPEDGSPVAYSGPIVRACAPGDLPANDSAARDLRRRPRVAYAARELRRRARHAARGTTIRARRPETARTWRPDNHGDRPPSGPYRRRRRLRRRDRQSSQRGLN